MTYEKDNVDSIIKLVNSYYEFSVVTATQISVDEALEIDYDWVTDNVIDKNVGVYKLEYINGITHVAIFPTMKLPIEVLVCLADSMSNSFDSETDNLLQWNYTF